LVDSQQHMFASRSHVRHEFTNTKKLVKKLARIEASSICRQLFANALADCICAVHTHQLEFANTSLPTLICRVKAASHYHTNHTTIIHVLRNIIHVQHTNNKKKLQ